MSGPLLVPSSMSVLRIKQYLARKLNNSAALTRGVEGEEVTVAVVALVLTDGTELDDEQLMGDVADRANSDASKEKALRVWYKRRTLVFEQSVQASNDDSSTKAELTTDDEHKEVVVETSAAAGDGGSHTS